jgi:hypothetical protein
MFHNNVMEHQVTESRCYALSLHVVFHGDDCFNDNMTRLLKYCGR